MKKLLLLSIFILLIGCSKPSLEYSVNITSNPIEGGIVNPNGGIYVEGETVVFKVTPNSAFEFVNWSGDYTSSSATISISIDRDLSITANFQSNDLDKDGVINLYDECPNTPEGSEVDSKGCVSPMFLDINGITVKCEDWAEEGKIYELNGVDYKVVSEQQLRNMVSLGENITNVCVSKVTNMSELFAFSPFNGDISGWDVSNVTDMRDMFYAAQFNQDISSWDVSNVINMTEMFGNSYFNQNISLWDVSSVTNMSRMFSHSKFNGDISLWDVSKVTNMSYLFDHSSFSGNISSWNVVNVNNMESMFRDSSFDEDISSWDVSSVKKMNSMFDTSSFNGDISSWNVSNVEEMSSMFFKATAFNQDLSSWDVSKVSIMGQMFKQSEEFNQDLSSWNVINVVYCDEFSFYSMKYTLPKPVFTNCNCHCD